MTKERRSRKLPTGELTYSVDEYVDAWQDRVKPLTTLLGWRLCSMDPGYTLEDPYGDRLTLTVSQVDQLVLALISSREPARAPTHHANSEIPDRCQDGCWDLQGDVN